MPRLTIFIGPPFAALRVQMSTYPTWNWMRERMRETEAEAHRGRGTQRQRHTEAEAHRGIRHLDFAAYAFPFGRAVALLPHDLVLWIPLLDIPCEQSHAVSGRERESENQQRS